MRWQGKGARLYVPARKPVEPAGMPNTSVLSSVSDAEHQALGLLRCLWLTEAVFVLFCEYLLHTACLAILSWCQLLIWCSLCRRLRSPYMRVSIISRDQTWSGDSFSFSYFQPFRQIYHNPREVCRHHLTIPYCTKHVSGPLATFPSTQVAWRKGISYTGSTPVSAQRKLHV